MTLFDKAPRNSEFEYQSRRDLSGEHLVDAGVDVFDPADVADDPGAARGVQLEYLRDVKPRADDRADDRNAFEYRLEYRELEHVILRQCDKHQAAAALERVEGLAHRHGCHRH